MFFYIFKTLCVFSFLLYKVLGEYVRGYNISLVPLTQLRVIWLEREREIAQPYWVLFMSYHLSMFMFPPKNQINLNL